MKKNGKLARAVVTITRFRGSSPNENGRLLGSELHLSAMAGREMLAQLVYFCVVRVEIRSTKRKSFRPIPFAESKCKTTKKGSPLGDAMK